jgi:hypothetical protein
MRLAQALARSDRQLAQNLLDQAVHHLETFEHLLGTPPRLRAIPPEVRRQLLELSMSLRTAIGELASMR